MKIDLSIYNSKNVYLLEAIIILVPYITPKPHTLLTTSVLTMTKPIHRGTHPRKIHHLRPPTCLKYNITPIIIHIPSHPINKNIGRRKGVTMINIVHHLPTWPSYNNK